MALARLLGKQDQILDNNGNPLAGGLVNLYEPNTTNRISSYTGSDLVTQNANPVKLSGAGRADIWVTRNCDLRITDKDGNLLIEELSVNPDDLGGVFDSGLVPNGSFETDSDSDGTPDGWDIENEGASSNNGQDNTQSTDGGYSYRTQSAGSGGGELVTEDFFPVNDVDDLRVDFDLLATVANVRNIVRVEWYDISQVAISNSDVYDSTANPLTWTSQVLTATPPAGARFAKLRIFGGTTGGLGAGITYWDRFHVYYPTLVSGVFDNITISGNDVISTNTNGDVNITPNGTGDTVIKNLEALTQAQLGFAGEVTLELAAANRVRIRADVTAATPPTTETPVAAIDFYDSDASDILGAIGFDAANDIVIVNRMHGGGVQVQAEDTAGVLRTLINADPDGQTTGAVSLSSWQAGSDWLGSATATRPALMFETPTANNPTVVVNRDDVDTGVGWAAANQMTLIAGGAAKLYVIHGAGASGHQIRIGPTTPVIGSAATPALAFGDGDTGFYESADDVLNVSLGASLRWTFSGDLLQSNNTAGAALENSAASSINPTLIPNRNSVTTGIGAFASGQGSLIAAAVELLRWRDYSAADRSSGAAVKGADGTLHDIGFNLLPRYNINGGNHTLAQADQGKTGYYDDAVARSLIVNNDGDIPVDAYFHVRVADGAGTLTVDAGTGVTLVYWNGASYTSHTVAGNLTLGEGSYTIWKQTDTEFYVDGPNITPV